MTEMNLALIRSDEVVRAQNNLKQHFFKLQKAWEGGGEHNTGDFNIRTVVHLLGDLLVAIRRGMSNESTKIEGIGLLEWLVKDATDCR